jgi:hypothetical protein
MSEVPVTISGQLALASAAVFTGAAFYINWAEQPARRKLDDKAQLEHWKPAYQRGFAMQAPLALIGFFFAAVTWMHGAHWLWLAGGLILLANWPYTLLVIMPVNTVLEATKAEEAGPQSRLHIARWGQLHGFRTFLGALATLLLLIASCLH